MIDSAHFTPAASLAGGLLIGASTSALLWLDGKVAGISGIVGGLLRPARGDVAWRVCFVAGLLGAGYLLRAIVPALFVDATMGSFGVALLAGFLVGVGTRLGGGCTSGHGVCGLSRGSRRSFVATLVYMATGMATVFLVRHVLGGIR
jgi:hypothetical protein